MPISDERTRTVTSNDVYLWTVTTDYWDSITKVCALQAILSPDEQGQAERFLHAKDRCQFVIAHALVRLALSYYFPVRAPDWRFSRDFNRKPFIAGPNLNPKVQFSLSHTEGLVACLITLAKEAAVDVEKIEYKSDLRLVAAKVLSAKELMSFRDLKREDWTAAFFAYWTLKESYAKAKGLGLKLNFSDIEFELGMENTIRINFPSLTEDPSAWEFWHRRSELETCYFSCGQAEFLRYPNNQALLSKAGPCLCRADSVALTRLYAL